MKGYKEKLKKLKETGFFSIFTSSVICKIITFFSGVVLIRILTKSEYGLYSYVLNAISMLTLFYDFGASNSILQYLTENSNDKIKQKQTLKLGIRVGIISMIFSGLLILLSPLYYPFTIDNADKLVPLLFLMPFFNFANAIVPAILRSKLENKKYARLQIVTIIIHYAVLFPMTILFSILGAILSQYVYSLIILIYGLFLVKDYVKTIKSIQLTDKDNAELQKEKKRFWRFSLATQLTNTIGGFLLICDTFLIGLIFADEELIATYKVATIIPQALAFIPTCIVIYILPYFIKNNKNKKWLKENYNKTIKYCSLIFGSLSFLLIAFSKLIFYILYGKTYYSAIPIYIVLVIGFFFSASIKIPSVNITYGLRKVKVNLIINILCLVVNFISNIIFIKWLGIIGAAITTTLINFISSMIYYIYVTKLLK